MVTVIRRTKTPFVRCLHSFDPTRVPFAAVIFFSFLVDFDVCLLLASLLFSQHVFMVSFQVFYYSRRSATLARRIASSTTATGFLMCFLFILDKNILHDNILFIIAISVIDISSIHNHRSNIDALHNTG